MSEENVEIVRRLYGRWLQGDFSVGSDDWDPDIEFVVDLPGGVERYEARGVEAMSRIWRSQLEAWEQLEVGKIEKLIDAGEHIVVLNSLWGRGRHSGAEVTAADRGAVFTFLDGKVVRLFLTTRERALEAAGLSE